jgi:hypothetical protein
MDKPLNNRKMNRITIFNESMVSASIAQLPFMTDLILEPLDKHRAGFGPVFLILFTTLVNSYFILFEMLKGGYLKGLQIKNRCYYRRKRNTDYAKKYKHYS